MTPPKCLRWFLLAALLSILACDHDKGTAEGQTPPAANNGSADSPALVLNLPADTAPAPAFDGERTLQYVKDIVKFGPRPLGSASHKKVEDYIASHLKGDLVEDDIFTADTPE